MRERCEVVFVGGRSGVGKTTAALALHAMLTRRDVAHAVIEGDALDLAHPAPWQHALAERNLAAMWRNYADLGYRRLVFTNTVSVLHAAELAEAMGGDPRVIAVLLRAADDTVRARLAERETGAELDAHVTRSDAAARRLDAEAPSRVHRSDTDGRTPSEVAEAILALTGWADR
jgi:broad-specificity NMP kinase